MHFILHFCTRDKRVSVRLLMNAQTDPRNKTCDGCMVWCLEGTLRVEFSLDIGSFS